MVRKIIRRLLAPRHPWRGVSFTEMNEMYVAGFLKNIALGMVAIFVPLYLIDNGFQLQEVLLYYATLYGFNLINNIISAYLTAWFGPKHVMRLGFFFLFMHSVLLMFITKVPAALLLLPLVHSLSGCLYWLPHHVDFSKIKNTEHGGKELGWLSAVEKVGSVAGPLLGGAIATLFGPHLLFAVSATIVVLAMVVLMLTPEPVRTRQKLRFGGLFKEGISGTFAHMAFMTENAITILLWPIFLAVIIFKTEAYLKIGAVNSASAIVSVLAAVPLARLLDRKGGLKMLRFGVIFNSLVHICRVVSTTFIGVAAISFLNEPSTLVYRLPFLKAFYDAADDYPEQRIAFITKTELCGHALCFLMFSTLAGIAGILSDRAVLNIGFVYGAIFSLAILLQKYRLLKK